MTAVLVVVPTFEEADNIPGLLAGIRAEAPGVDVLVVDDNSPDGTANLAIGSRYVPGGAIPTWSTRRRALSRYGNRYAGWVLGVNAADLTSGFRAFRTAGLCRAGYEATRATGYAFQIELAYRVVLAGGRIAEVPITFNDRARGRSKMSTRITLEALTLVTAWGLRDRVLRRKRAGAPATSPRGALV